MHGGSNEPLTSYRGLTVMLVLSGLLNVFLGLRVISQERSRRPVPHPRITEGALLESVIGVDPDGAPLTIRFADSHNSTVLLILRPGCPWCDKNMPNWHALIDGKAQNFRFVTVSLSATDLKRYLRENGLPLPAIVPQLGKNPTFDQVTGTPQTIVVGPDSKVRKVWFGAFTTDLKRDVEAFFGLDLPVAVRTGD